LQGSVTSLNLFLFTCLENRQYNSTFFLEKNPATDFSKLSKINFPFAIIISVSIIVHFFVHTKIYIYKNKVNNKVNEQNYQQNKSWFLKTLEKQSLLNFTIISCFLFTFGILIFLNTKLAHLEPHKLNEYPYYIMIYWINLSNSLLVMTFLSALVYCRNATMRRIMAREIKQFLRRSFSIDFEV